MCNPLSLPARARRGATIAEVLVALVLTTIGLLALAGAETQAWRRRAAADRGVRATEVARDRAEVLASMRCGEAAAGNAMHAGGVHERWAVEAGDGAHLIVTRVEWPTTQGTDSVQLAASRWCGR